MATVSDKINLPVEENKANGTNEESSKETDKHISPSSKEEINRWSEIAEFFVKYGLYLGNIVNCNPSNCFKKDETIMFLKTLAVLLKGQGKSSDDVDEIIGHAICEHMHTEYDEKTCWYNAVSMEVKRAYNGVDAPDPADLRKHLYEGIKRVYTSKQGYNTDKARNMAVVLSALIVDRINGILGELVEPIFVVEHKMGSSEEYFISDPWYGIYIATIKQSRGIYKVDITRVSDYYIEKIEKIEIAETKDDVLSIVFRNRMGVPEEKNQYPTVRKYYYSFADGDLKAFLRGEKILVTSNSNKAVDIVRSIVAVSDTEYRSTVGVTRGHSYTGFVVEDGKIKFNVLPKLVEPDIPSECDPAKARKGLELLLEYMEAFGYHECILKIIFGMLGSMFSPVASLEYGKKAHIIYIHGVPHVGKTMTAKLVLNMFGLTRMSGKIKNLLLTGEKTTFASLIQILSLIGLPVLLDEVGSKLKDEKFAEFIKALLTSLGEISRTKYDGTGTKIVDQRAMGIPVFTLNRNPPTVAKELAARIHPIYCGEELKRDKDTIEEIRVKVRKNMEYLCHLGCMMIRVAEKYSKELLDWIERLGMRKKVMGDDVEVTVATLGWAWFLYTTYELDVRIPKEKFAKPVTLETGDKGKFAEEYSVKGVEVAKDIITETLRERITRLGRVPVLNYNLTAFKEVIKNAKPSKMAEIISKYIISTEQGQKYIDIGSIPDPGIKLCWAAKQDDFPRWIKVGKTCKTVYVNAKRLRVEVERELERRYGISQGGNMEEIAKKLSDGKKPMPLPSHDEEGGKWIYIPLEKVVKWLESTVDESKQRDNIDSAS